jgi:5-formyltetrahydrofolate cyclo-ligase
MGLLPELLVRVEIKSIAQAQIVFLPPAAKRRQIMRRHCRERALHVRGRRLETTIRALLEQQHLVVVGAIVFHRLRHRFGHGTQIFADHDAVVALALERENRNQVIHRIVHVGTVLRQKSARHPP